MHAGAFRYRTVSALLPLHKNNMCPQGLALFHPAAATLLHYATNGCRVNTGKPWTVSQMQAAIDQGPQVSALDPQAIVQMDAEIAEKVTKG